MIQCTFQTCPPWTHFILTYEIIFRNWTTTWSKCSCEADLLKPKWTCVWDVSLKPSVQDECCPCVACEVNLWLCAVDMYIMTLLFLLLFFLVEQIRIKNVHYMRQAPKSTCSLPGSWIFLVIFLNYHLFCQENIWKCNIWKHRSTRANSLT